MPRRVNVRAVVLYDRDCEFCVLSVAFATRRVRPRAEFVAWQDADLASLNVTPEQCSAAVQWVDPTGVYAGGRAVARALIKSTYPWAVLGALGNLPLIDMVVDRGYIWVADHRGLLMRALRRARIVTT